MQALQCIALPFASAIRPISSTSAMQCKALLSFANAQSNVVLCCYHANYCMQQNSKEQSTARQLYDCVCTKHGYGRIHKVSHTAWQQHLASASSEEECRRIRTARLLGERMTSLPPLAKHSFPPDYRHSVPPSVRRAEARRGLATRCREGILPTRYFLLFLCFYLTVLCLYLTLYFYLVFGRILAYVSQPSHLGYTVLRK
ncbi:hypothetical protein PISMIDRAFT_442908 [Pisolithus microcarpus 441]|uniref:Uncharacterized protein n=1 Tax=Pisolithus microcarpus 441 TaxID=765257 RepID=A0A0D0A5U7_9AGAM|nr:hypothetical protein BKA83DRAFT_442908 [Pisolithus microcarpus]KIK29822.1 hypothetical protein PISMIDRAFT_442908 [Pisolithus microcarpus 441]